ncbi:hypothetical protein MTO96_020806 [Rhipicephalus appendiculatus]
MDFKAATGRMMGESESEREKKTEDGCVESGAGDALPDYYNARGEKTFICSTIGAVPRTRALKSSLLLRPDFFLASSSSTLCGLNRDEQ